MKSTGIVRKVDELGRVVIPKELRDVLDINIKDPLEIFTEDSFIMLKKYNPGCSICGSMKRLSVFKEKNICQDCIDEISN